LQLCRKYNLLVSGCSQQPALFREEICIECLRKPSPSKIIIPRGTSRFGKAKSFCSICERPIYDNVNPEKIITCGSCVQLLLMTSRENRINFRKCFIEKKDLEGARSIEAFILEPEEEEEIREVKFHNIQSKEAYYDGGKKETNQIDSP